jgi:2-amino-4-ketopentanoate thiolase alpha subunit
MNGGPAIVPSGRWARIHRLELSPSERAPGIPADTASVPFETWINGWLVDDTAIGELCRLKTPSGRIVEGVLVEADPGYHHSFGSPPAALQHAGGRAFELLFGRGPA